MTEITGEFFKKPGDSRGDLIRIKSEGTIFKGEEGTRFYGKTFVRAGNSSKERAAGLFFTKILKPHISAEGVMKKYLWLKGKNLPVVPTLRYDRKTNTLLMTEMSEGGKKLLIDRHHPLSTYGVRVEQISNWSDLTNAVADLATRAYDNGDGMELDNDNYMIVLDKVKGGYLGRVCLVDIVYGANFLKDLKLSDRKRATFDENLKSTDVFINEIQGLPVQDRR